MMCRANRCATTARSPIDDPYLIPAPLPQHTQCRNPGVNCLGCSTLLLCNMNLDGTPTPILSFNCQNNGGASFCDAYQGTCVSESYACSHSRTPPGHSRHPGQRPPFVCRSRGLFADPELHDCSGYIVCLRPGGLPIRRLCGGNTRFSNTFQTCVSTLLAPPECFQQPPPSAFQCPYEGNFADTSSHDCTRYYECKSFGARGRQLVPVSRTCNFGEAFNDGAGRCMNSYFVRCNGVNPDVNYDGPVEELSACPSRDGAFADPNSPGDCASYIVCVNGCIVDRGRCPPGYVFVPSPDGRVSCSPTDYSPDCGQNSRSRQRSFFF